MHISWDNTINIKCYDRVHVIIVILHNKRDSHVKYDKTCDSTWSTVNEDFSVFVFFFSFVKSLDPDKSEVAQLWKAKQKAKHGLNIYENTIWLFCLNRDKRAEVDWGL